MNTFSLFQNRARRPGNKRPPSRQKLREAGSTSSPTNSESSVTSPNLLVKTAQEPPDAISHLENEIKEETGIFGTSPSKKVTITMDDDLFSSKKTSTLSSKQNGGFNDDLFDSYPPKKNAKPLKNDNDLFSTSALKGPGVKSQSQPTPTVSVFDSPPEDIFAPPPGKQVGNGEPDDLFAPGKIDDESASMGSKKLDVLLGSSSSSSKKSDKTKPGEIEETDQGQVRWTHCTLYMQWWST